MTNRKEVIIKEKYTNVSQTLVLTSLNGLPHANTHTHTHTHTHTLNFVKFQNTLVTKKV